jgi:hypothetical protein
MDLKISNFNLTLFKKLIEESMIVNNQLIIEVSSKDVKCCSLSHDKTLLKMWTLPLEQLIETPQIKAPKLSKMPSAAEIAEFDNIFNTNSSTDDLVTEVQNAEASVKKAATEPELFPSEKQSQKFDFKPFDVFILRAEHFKKFLDVHSNVNVSVEFAWQQSGDNDRKMAAEFVINSTIDGEGSLSTKYILSTDEMITTKITDIQKAIDKLTPEDNMYSVVLTTPQIQSVRNMVKSLHKANPINVPYLNIVVDPIKFTINISDAVFNIDYKLSTTNVKVLPKKPHNFSIFKSDFASFGNHDFTIYLREDANYALFLNPVIKCVTTFLPEEQTKDGGDAAFDSLGDASIDNINVDDYFN